MCNQCLSPLTLWVWIPLRWGVLDTTLCDNLSVAGLWFSTVTAVFSNSKNDLHYITEILLKVVLNIMTLTLTLNLYCKTEMGITICCLLHHHHDIVSSHLIEFFKLYHLIFLSFYRNLKLTRDIHRLYYKERKILMKD